MEKFQTIPKMLTIKEASKATKLSSYFIRKLVLNKTQKIKFIKSGCKYLINFNSLVEFMRNGEPEEIQK